MTKFFTYAIVIGLGATATLGLSNNDPKPGTGGEVRLSTDGAFRDGLYLGKLAAESKRQAPPAIGRWSTEQDRAMFAEGYRRGYSEQLAGPSAE